MSPIKGHLKVADVISTMEFIKSVRGSDKLLFEGYVYVKQKNLARGWVSYECERRRYANGCKGKVRVRGEDVMVVPGSDHTHAPDPARGDVLKVRQAMKERAQTTEEPSQQILSTNLGTATEGVAAQLPNLQDLRRNIRRQRQMAGNPLPVPESRDDIPHPLPERYATTADGSPFLVWDSQDDDRILVFAAENKLQLLQDSAHWLADGTFQTVPSLYYQLYTLHALVEGRTVPCVYALLPNKTRQTYVRLLQALTALNLNFNPESVMIDFEPAAKQGVQQVFPGAEVKGCFFHFSQNIYRKLQGEGLQQRYHVDQQFALEARQIAAMAFIPEADVDATFNLLAGHVDPALTPVLDYFEDNYIGTVRRGRRRPARFSYAMWGMHDRVGDHLPRTNNAVEGWHSTFSTNVGGCHVNFWKFLEVLQREEAVSQVQLTHIRQGREPPRPHPVYARINTRLTTVVGDYANRAPLDFLRAVAMNFAW